MLIDCLRLVGLDALAQVDLGTRQNCHQSLRALSAMAFEVMVAVERRTAAVVRPGTASFRPRPGDGGTGEKWRLHCEERPSLDTEPALVRPSSRPGREFVPPTKGRTE